MGAAAKARQELKRADLVAAMDGPKECKQCRQSLDRSHFHNDNRRSDGLFPYCKPCRRLRSGAQPMRAAVWKSKSEYDQARRERAKEEPDYHKAYRRKYLWTRYRLTEEEYDTLFADQSGVCAICKMAQSYGRALAVDHDHACCPGKSSCGSCIRGLLCNNCNTVLGHLRDDVDLMRKAVDYLTSYRSQQPSLSLFEIA